MPTKQVRYLHEIMTTYIALLKLNQQIWWHSITDLPVIMTETKGHL